MTLKNWYVVTFLCILMFPFATTMGQKKPAWTSGVFFSTPNSDVRSFDATGATEDEARNKAAARIIEWKSGSAGLRAEVKIENNAMVVTSESGLEVKARVIYEYREIGRNEYRVYLLVQVARVPDNNPFDDITHILKKVDNPFFAKGRNSYLAWGINAGYPMTAGTSFAGRHGGIVGVGYYLNVGVDIGIGSDSDFIPLQYQVGVKFFPYRSFFLSAGYGTLGCENANVFNDSKGNWNTSGWRQGEGLILMAGCDMLGNLNNGGGLFLSAGAGVSQNMITGSWQPLINIKFGFAWGL